jgi:hypothetical protein
MMGFAFKVAGNYSGRKVMKPRRTAYQTSENPWRPYRLKVFPKRINGKWYRPGDTVYRRRVMDSNGGYYKYGDDFDFMKGR